MFVKVIKVSRDEPIRFTHIGQSLGPLEDSTQPMLAISRTITTIDSNVIFFPFWRLASFICFIILEIYFFGKLLLRLFHIDKSQSAGVIPEESTNASARFSIFLYVFPVGVLFGVSNPSSRKYARI
jgi:hypothetical protein